MACTYIDYIRGLLAKSVHAHTVTARAGERAERERGRRGDRARVDAVSAASAHGVAPSPHWSLVIRTAWALGLAVAELPLTLSSQPIYHLTVFPAQKWLIKRIDQLRRSFLWRGETPDKVYGGHSLINWPTTNILAIVKLEVSKYGGLGISDLDCFARALRLRWM